MSVGTTVLEAKPSSYRTSGRSGRSGIWEISRIRRIGYGLLLLQLVGLLIWSNVLTNRFALTFDFSVYHQPWWLIGHGNLDPYDSLQSFPWWQGHGEFMLWPLALLGAIWPHPVAQLWVQDLFVVGAEAVALSWLCDLASTPSVVRRDPKLPGMLAGLGLVLLVANPWIYWAVSFDFHMEVIGALFLLLVGRDLWRNPNSRRVWLWVALALSCGDVVATYLIGLGLSMSLAGRRWRRKGLSIAGVAFLWVIFLTGLGAHKASGFAATYGYLETGAAKTNPASFGLFQVVSSIAKHPTLVVRQLWDRRLNLYSNIAPAGLLGVLSPLAVMPTTIVLVENGLSHNLGFLSTARFQDILMFLLVPVGTVAFLAWLARRHRRAVLVLMGLIAANTIAWAVVWLPQTATQWIRTSAAASSTLASIERQIPESDQVVASQGISGAFSGRRWISTIIGPAEFSTHTRTVWVIVAPSQGVELASVAVSDGLIAQLAGPLRATLVTEANGIWAFRWTPPSDVHMLVVSPAAPTVEAWTSPGAAGSVTTTGPSSSWRAMANGQQGDVVDGDYWRELPGQYQATTVLSSTVPINVEVWNATADELLARRSIPPTSGYAAIAMPVDLNSLAPAKLYGGVSPFAVDPVPPAPGNQLEIRVWTPGGGLVSVASLELVRAR